MKQTSDFEVIRFEGLELLRYQGASARGVRTDLYLTGDTYGRQECYYAQMVPRFRPEYPTPQEFADETLDHILELAWRNTIPDDARQLLSRARVCVFDGHGNHYKGIGWGVHIQDDKVIPISRLLEQHLSGYDTTLLTVCNPKREHPEIQAGSIIYPLGLFGPDAEDFQMAMLRYGVLTSSP